MASFAYPKGRTVRPVEKTCRSGHSFFGPRCLACKRLYSKRYWMKHQAQRAAHQKRYKDEHREAQRAYWRAYYDRNRAAMQERGRVYYERRKVRAWQVVNEVYNDTATRTSNCA